MGGAKGGQERANDPSCLPKNIGKINEILLINDLPRCDRLSKGLGKKMEFYKGKDLDSRYNAEG